MLTEKAIRDNAFCPALWLEKEGNAKRLKPDRSWEDNTAELIVSALTTTNPNKKAYAEKLTIGSRAIPYDGKDFWLVIQIGDHRLLLTTQEVTLTRDEEFKNWIITVKRKQQRQPHDEDLKEAEEMVRRALWLEFRRQSPNTKVIVETHYTSAMHPTQTKVLSHEEINETEKYFHRLYETANKDYPRVPKFERCPICFWKSCPVRQTKPDTNLRGGIPQTEIL